MSKARHVIPSPSGGWSVRQSGALKATRTFGNQADAVKFAKKAAKKAQTELYVHRADGTIRDVNSYRSDPFSPRTKN